MAIACYTFCIMVKQKTKNKRKVEDEEGDETVGEMMSMKNMNLERKLSFFFLFLSVLLTCSLVGAAGSVGNFIFETSTLYLGLYAYLLPFFSLTVFYFTFRKNAMALVSTRSIIIALLLLTVYVLIGNINIIDKNLGGLFGETIANFLNEKIGMYPAIFLALSTFVATIFLLLEKSFELPNLSMPKFSLSSLFSNKRSDDDDIELDDYDEEIEQEEQVAESGKRDVRDQMFRTLNIDTVKNNNRQIKVNTDADRQNQNDDTEETENSKTRKIKAVTKYEKPPLNLYEEDSGKPSAGDNKENARLIKRTMQNFGISVEMDEVSVGPTVTRYCLKPAQGVRLTRIAQLDKNLAMELSTTTVRIEAPVPGRSVVGIEIPNKSKATIGIGTMFADAKFQEDPRALLMAIGKDIGGQPIYADLAKMPHLLVAGMTGAGKSAMIHSLIHSLVYRNAPDELKFIMIDPKKVELSFYQKLPHLYTPVIKEPKKAVQTLNWLVQEMERRYEVLEENGKQNIAGYHSLVNEKMKKGLEPERMPYIVVVIDELADFMMAYPKEMESGIVRLAQKSRAVGMHLILSTQKPLATIVSSVIKANVPGRIALKVSSRMDSMVILDNIGAEKLLGAGDLLLVGSDGAEMKRIQSPYISEKEIVRVVDYLKNKYDDFVPEELTLASVNGGGNVVGSFNLDSGMGGDSDDKYEEAKNIVIEMRNCSATFLQRKMGIGYSRAAKIIDMLESNGIIGKANGSKPREILVQNNAGSKSSDELEEEADEILGDSADDRF
jgi:DNA segregation ATPase FtsK/SpoIIIE, S-DNA-T family